MPNREIKNARDAKPPPSPPKKDEKDKAPPPNLGSTIQTIKDRKKMLDEI